MPNIWVRLPYLSKRGDSLVKFCVSKIRRYLQNPIKFIIIYDIKKVSYFCPNKDKVQELSGSKTYVGKTDRCVYKRLTERSTQLNTSAVAQHLTECEHAQFLANLQGQYDRLNNLPSFSNSSNSIKNLIFNNYKILYSSKSTNTNKLLLIEEALHLKFNKPEMNSGLKASKELTLFNWRPRTFIYNSDLLV